MKNKSRYYRFSDYLKERFKERVYKVSVDAGFSCPNLDGTLSDEGCIFCNNKAFSYFSEGNKENRTNNKRNNRPSLKEQIEKGIAFGKKRYQAGKFMVYFQAFTNTYADIDELYKKYSIIRKFPEVVALAVGTRPDIIDDKKLDLIAGFKDDYEAWIEYGLQSIHDKTLKLINRNHTYGDFLAAYKKTKEKGIKVCAHVIIGLPDEGRDDIMATARQLGFLGVDAVKIHPLHVVKKTALERLHKDKKYNMIGFADFIDLTAQFLRYLQPDTVIERVSATCPHELLIGPDWINDKQKVIKALDEKLEELNAYQGDKQKHRL